MRWIACVNAPFQGVIKHRILKELKCSFQEGTLVITDFYSVKLMSLKEFRSFPDYMPEFFRDKIAYGLAIDLCGDISYCTNNGVSLVTNFFSEDFTQKWSDEAYYTESLKSVNDQLSFINALEQSKVQVITKKDDYFGFCRKHPASLQYGRMNRTGHILTDSNEIIYGPEIKKVYVNTSPTLISMKDFSIFRIETD